MSKLWCYVRKPIDEVYYDPRIAYSMHLALEENGEVKALNHNSGILFGKATENADGSLNPKCLKNPWIKKLSEDRFEIYAIQTGAEGEEDPESQGMCLFFTTSDFISYKEHGLIRMNEEYKAYLSQLEKVDDQTADTPDFSDIEGGIVGNGVEISEEVCTYLKKKLLTPYHVDTLFDSSRVVTSKEELMELRAERVFSDGTKDSVIIDWDLSKVDFSKKGNYQVKGKLHQEHFAFPMAENHADPCMGKWNGKYYFIATFDADHEHTMYIREGNSIPELVNAKEHLILDSTTYEGIGGLLWAPEFHVIGGKLCILHAATPDPFFEEESRVMILKEGGNPICKQDWEGPRRIVKADGTDICEAGKEITLDMTHFVWNGEDYVIWSQRQFLPKDLGAWLYIAKLNPEKPWMLASDPIVLTKPEYGWENNHTFVVEGPYALFHEDTLNITYSAAAVDTSYVVGLLSIKKGQNLLDPKDWKKKNYPILTSRSVDGEFGTGHNAYIEDENGTVYTTYHARPGVDAPRCSGVREVHFDVDGEPMLDVTENLFLNQNKAFVSCTLTL